MTIIFDMANALRFKECVDLSISPTDAATGGSLVATGDGVTKQVGRLSAAIEGNKGLIGLILRAEAGGAAGGPVRIDIEARCLRGGAMLQVMTTLADGTADIADRAAFLPTPDVQERSLLIERCGPFLAVLILHDVGAPRTDIEIRRIKAAGIDAGSALNNERNMVGIYDLRADQLSFDFFSTLCFYELRRAELGLDGVFVILVPTGDRVTDDQRHPSEYRAAIDADARQWRLFHMAIPVLQLFPRIAGFCLAGDKFQALAMAGRAAHRFPETLSVQGSHARNVQVYRSLYSRLGTVQDYRPPRAPGTAIHIVERWLYGQDRTAPLVTITLRQSDYDVARNSNLEDWARFAQWAARDFLIAIVVDTDKLFVALPEAFGDLPRFDAASLNVGVRLALYERAHLNLIVNSGPVMLAILSETIRYLFFKPVDVATNVRSASYDWLNELGAPIHRSPRFATPFQKWVWKDDSFENIRVEFERMCEKIAPGGG